MEEQLIEFSTAKLAKEKGFDLKVENFYTRPKSKMFGVDEHGRYYSIKNTSKKLYNIYDHAVLKEVNVIYAPTQSLLQKWLREEHKIHISISAYPDGYYFEVSSIPKTLMDDLYSERNRAEVYEQALEKGLFEALKLIKDENNK